MSEDNVINILLVDDIAETRESIKKLLAFEPDFRVIGSASNGREGVQQAKELQPDIIIMDINMPDMDGLEAAGLITKAVPTAGVIMMSVQNDADYMQRAMLAGARFFLSKPVDMDQLYNTIRNVYGQYEQIRRREEMYSDPSIMVDLERASKEGAGERAGHIIAVYSPQGGAGCTTIATSLASGLMKEGIKVLLVDADLQFGDVRIFLNLTSQSTLVELAESVDDLDVELLENVVVTHDSGMKALLGPPRPALADEIRETNPSSIATIIDAVATHYDFVVVDTSSALDSVTVPILDLATRVLLVLTPTLPAIKNVRLVMDLFDQLGYPPDKTVLTINKGLEEKGRKKGATLSADRIQNYLKRNVEGVIPAVDERFILSAINKAVPVIAADRDQNKPPIKQLLELSNHLYLSLMGSEDAEAVDEKESGSRRFSFGRER